MNLRPRGNDSWNELLASLTELLASLVDRNEVRIPAGEERGYSRLLTTGSFEVCLIAWKPSARSRCMITAAPED